MDLESSCLNARYASPSDSNFIEGCSISDDLSLKRKDPAQEGFFKKEEKTVISNLSVNGASLQSDNPHVAYTGSENSESFGSFFDTPHPTSTPLVKSLPRPSICSKHVMRQLYCRPPLNLSVTEFFNNSNDKHKRKSSFGEYEGNGLSFRILDPYELLRFVGVEAAKILTNPAHIPVDRLKFLSCSYVASLDDKKHPTFLQDLGVGESGLARKYISDDGRLLVKKQRRILIHGNDELALVLKEAAALSRLSHVNIVGFIECYVLNGRFFIEMDYCNGIGLRKMIDNNLSQEKIPSEEQAKGLLSQMLNALSHLKIHGIVHFDIKPENIFTHDESVANINCFNDFNQSNIIFKLGDFGQCFISNLINIDVNEGDCRYLARDGLDLSLINYIEMDDSVTRPSPECDIFSLSLTVVEYCGSGYLPSGGEYWHEIRDGNLPKISSNFSQELVTILTRMISPDPKMRPLAADLLQAEYFHT